MTTGSLTQMMISRSPLLLDGAMGTELQRRGVESGLPLWSAAALIACPDVVLQIHRDYITAGADIITTNTFRTTRRTFRRARQPDRSAELTTLAVKLAQQARLEHPDRDILIAGSIAPLEDCYRPDLVPPDSELHEEHRNHAERLVQAGVDFLLLETMGTIREAAAACAAAAETGHEVVVSFICRKDGNLYGGESLTGAVRAVLPYHPAALSVNCVSPQFMGKAIRALRSATSLPLAAYANVGVPDHERREGDFTRSVSEIEYGRNAAEWLSEGTSIVGGCCGTTPEYVKMLSAVVGRTSRPEQPHPAVGV